MVRFRLNQIQDRYNSQRTSRDIILKARQFGFTSFILAEFTIEALSVPNTRVVIVAQLAATAVMMLRKVQTYISRLYDEDKFRDIPLEVESKNEIRIRETNSTIYIGTAESKKFGRGDTVHRLLLSEYAQYENPEDITTGIMQTVPATGRIVIETTANGYNHFRDLYYASKRNQTTFKSFFFPWFLHTEYQTIGAPLTDKSREELALQEQIPEITDNKLRWYRKKKIEMDYSTNDPTLIRQEYPATDHEAFISSGNKVFNTKALETLLAKVKRPIMVGDVDVNGHFTTDVYGFVSIWELPKPGLSYVIGGDPSEGLSTGDPAAAVVMERVSARIVAVWHGYKDADQFGDDLTGLGLFYNTAVVGPEANNHGIATIIKIRDNGYQNLYNRVSYDTVSQKTSEQLGWKTDLKTKPMMIGELKALVRDGQVDIPDERIITEMLSFEEKEKTNQNQEYKKMGAALGAHDDFVIATAIAVQLRKFTPTPFVGDLPTSYLDKPYGQGNVQTGPDGFPEIPGITVIR